MIAFVYVMLAGVVGFADGLVIEFFSKVERKRERFRMSYNLLKGETRREYYTFL